MSGIPDNDGAVLRVATYNVHDCVGRDRRFDAGRIAQVLVELEADVIALQEVTQDHAGELVDRFEAATGLTAVDGSLFERGVGRYGNLLLTRPAVEYHRLHDLSLDGHEPRGCVEAALRAGAGRLRAFATHLGLKRRERARQIAALAGEIRRRDGAALVLGDLNVWLGATALAPLAALGFRQQAVPSYPTWPVPLAVLDRILARPPLEIARSWRHKSVLARVASDHFPVLAEVCVPAYVETQNAAAGCPGRATGTGSRHRDGG